MSSNILVEGGNTLSGTVKMSGAKNSALKLIAAAMLSSEDIILDNVPRIQNVITDLETIASLGGKYEWLGPNKLLLNGSNMSSFEIPYELGSKYRTASLLAGPIIYKFGKAIVPKPGGCRIGPRPINRFVDTWRAFGMEILEDETHYIIRGDSLHAADINFSISTHTGTDNAIICASFLPGESFIHNAAEEPEVDDLIAFCNMIGAKVERVEPRVIKIQGTNVFGGGNFTVQPDRNEAVTFAVAVLVAGGNLTIKNVKREHLISFTSVLTKMDCNYEFSKDELRVWRDVNKKLSPVNIVTAIAPGFMTDWQPLITLLLTQASGVSTVHDTVYTDRFGYIKDLNRMGANIKLHRPSELGMEAVISDDLYDLEKLGEPYTVAKITGPTRLKGTKLEVPDLRAGATLILAALAADGKSEISGYENVSRGYEGFLEKLSNIGADVEMLS